MFVKTMASNPKRKLRGMAATIRDATAITLNLGEYSEKLAMSLTF